MIHRKKLRLDINALGKAFVANGLQYSSEQLNDFVQSEGEIVEISVASILRG